MKAKAYPALGLAVIFFILASGFASAAGTRPPDLNVVKIERWIPAGDGNAFSYSRDSNLTIDFNVGDVDINILDLNVHGAGISLRAQIYRSTNMNQFQTAIIADLNLLTPNTAGDFMSGSKYCDDFNFNSRIGTLAEGGDPGDANTGTTCHWDFNIEGSLVADGNFFIDINVYDAIDTNKSDSTDFNFIVDNLAPTVNVDFNADINKTGGTEKFTYPSTDFFIGWDQNITVKIVEATNRGAGDSHLFRIDLNFWDVNNVRFGDVNAATRFVNNATDVNWSNITDVNVQKFKYADGNVVARYMRAVIRDWAGNSVDYNITRPILFFGFDYPPGLDQNGNSTNFQDINDFERVKLLKFSKSGFGRVIFTDDVNLGNHSIASKIANLSTAFKVTRLTGLRSHNDLNIWLDSVYFSDLNLAVGITLYGAARATDELTPGIKTAGDQNCGTICTGISFNTTTQQLDFNITHFTDYYSDSNSPTITNTTTASQSIPAVISVTTDEIANCKYSTLQLRYDSMTNVMSGSGTTSHKATITTGASGESATYYVACEDVAGNGSAGTSVSFNITAGGGGGAQEVCGDNACNGTETAATCPQDCAPVCGDNACTGTETPETCPQDCVVGCGDKVCDAEAGETCSTCAEDCGACPTVPGEEEVLRATVVEQPSITQIADVLREAGYTTAEIDEAKKAAERVSVERRLVVVSKEAEGEKTFKSTLTITVNNISGVELKNVRIVERIPKEIAQTTAEITSNVPFAVLKEDPIVQFTVSSIAADGSASISYSVAKEITAGQLGLFIAPITAYAVEYIPGITTCEQISCDDRNPCTRDLCAEGECSYALERDGTPCGFGKECRAGTCTEIAAKAAPEGIAAGAGPYAATGVVVAVVIIALAVIAIYKRKKK